MPQVAERETVPKSPLPAVVVRVAPVGRLSAWLRVHSVCVAPSAVPFS